MICKEAHLAIMVWGVQLAAGVWQLGYSYLINCILILGLKDVCLDLSILDLLVLLRLQLSHEVQG